jgi:hypothetical protein
MTTSNDLKQIIRTPRYLHGLKYFDFFGPVPQSFDSRTSIHQGYQFHKQKAFQFSPFRGAL